MPYSIGETGNARQEFDSREPARGTFYYTHTGDEGSVSLALAWESVLEACARKHRCSVIRHPGCRWTKACGAANLLA